MTASYYAMLHDQCNANLHYSTAHTAVMVEPTQLFRALLERSNTNPTELSRRLKTTTGRNLQSGLSRWLSGSTRAPDPETLRPFADHFGVDVSAFYSAKAATDAARQLGILGESENAVQIPRPPEQPVTSVSSADELEIVQWQTGGAMGHGLVLRDQPGVIHSWKVSHEWVKKNIPHCSSVSNVTIVTGFGDSMKGMFNSGDPLIVDTGFRVVDVDAVYFFRVGEEGFIKRLQRMPGPTGEMRIKVKSKNPDYDDWYIERGMDFEVFGRVIKVWQGENL